jgi:hypothetical protein
VSQFTLEIDEVVVLTEAERVELEAAAPAIREAFRLLGERLDRSPFGQFGEARTYAIARLETTAVPLDELLSPRGAERLADELYRQLLRGSPWPTA